MLIREIIWVALGAIRANKLRSFLTTLGIIIGVSAVIAMVSLGEGARRTIEEQISSMGTNVLTPNVISRSIPEGSADSSGMESEVCSLRSAPTWRTKP